MLRIISATTAAAGRAVTLLRVAVPARRLDHLSLSASAPVALLPAAAAFGTRGFASGDAVASEAVSGGSTPSRTWEAPSGRKEFDLSGRSIQLDLVEKYLSESCMSSEDLNKAKLGSVRKDFARHELDCGSTEVQVAGLTTRIQNMILHRTKHKKDNVSKRSLEAMLNQRRKLLRYLRRTDGDRYGDLIFRLGLRDNVVGVKGRLARAK